MTDDVDDDPRARDLVRAGTLPSRVALGERAFERLAARAARRPVGASARLWRRVTGSDPFEDGDDVPLGRRSVYVEDRLVRLDDGATPPAAPRARPTADERPGNLGEALIPPGFRDLPIARSAPPPTPKAAAPPPPVAPPPKPPAPPPAIRASGRIPATPRRTPTTGPVAPPPAAPTPPPTPAAPEPTPAAPAPPEPTDPLATPADGRARLGRRKPPTG